MHPLLSARQEQCLRLTAFRTDKEIAVHLGISEATVKKHVHEACQRLRVNRRKAALALMDPIVPDSVTTPPSRTDVGYPKHPMALHQPGDHACPDEKASVEDGIGKEPAADVDGHPGYRVPPRNPVLRLVMIVVLTIVIASLVVTLVSMLGDMHEAVGKIDAANAAVERVAAK